MQSKLLLVVVVLGTAIVAEHYIGPIRHRLGKPAVSPNWALARDDDNCSLSESDPGVLYFEFPLTDTWAYAGVQPNPRYFCTRTLESQSIRMVMYKILRSFTCTYRPQNDTTCMASSVGGCWFPFPFDCSDPTMQQQIVASGLCRSNGTPQQVVNGLMLAINRPNWLFIGDHLESFDAFDSYPDDNFCAVWMVDIPNEMVILSVRVDVS